MNNKNKIKNHSILLFITLITLIIFIGLGAYTWFLFFLNIQGDQINNTNRNRTTGTITLNDKNKSLYIDDATSIDDEEIDDIKPYVFVISNSSNKEGKYVLYIEDLPLNMINDGCTSSTLLTREQLKYELKLNNKVVQSGYLSDIKDNILDKRDIGADALNYYELRIYIHEDAEDWISKHYHYRVVLNNKKEDK